MARQGDYLMRFAGLKVATHIVLAGAVAYTASAGSLAPLNLIGYTALVVIIWRIDTVLRRRRLASFATQLPLASLYVFYVLPSLCSPPEFGWLHRYTLLSASNFADAFLYSTLLAGALLIAAWLGVTIGSRPIVGPHEDKARRFRHAGLVAVYVGCLLLGVSLWAVVEFLPVLLNAYSTAATAEPRLALSTPAGGMGGYALLIKWAECGAILVGWGSGVALLGIRGKKVLIATSGSVAALVAAPFLGRLAFVLSALGPIVGYWVATRREVSLITLMNIVLLGLAPLAVGTEAFRPHGGEAIETTLERMLLHDVGRFYVPGSLMASGVTPTAELIENDFLVFGEPLRRAFLGKPAIELETTLSAYSSLVAGYSSSHMVPGFAGAWYMAVGPHWLFLWAPVSVFLLMYTIARLNTSSKPTVRLITLFMTYFVTRHYWMHSNNMGQPVFYLILPAILAFGTAYALWELMRHISMVAQPSPRKHSDASDFQPLLRSKIRRRSVASLAPIGVLSVKRSTRPATRQSV